MPAPSDPLTAPGRGSPARGAPGSARGAFGWALGALGWALGALGWALVAAAFGASVANLEPSLLEEGIVVHAAERMAAGEHLYRDILVFTAPLPYELLALLFRTLGLELLVARFAVVALQALASGLIFACARRAGLGAAAHAAAASLALAPPLLVPLFSTFYYTTLAYFLAVCAMAAALAGTRSRAWAVAAGALVGGVALCKQHVGVLLALALLPGLLLGATAGSRRARLLDYAVGGIGAALLTLALYALRGDLAALFHTQLALPLGLAGTSSYATPFLGLWPPGELDPESAGLFGLYAPSLYTSLYGLARGPRIVIATQLLYALPFAALAATAVRSLPGLSRPHPLVWLHGALLLAMTANLHPRPDWGHLYVALPPAAAQLFLLGARRAPGRRETALAGALAACAIGVLGVGAGWAALALRTVSGEPQLGPRVPLRPVSIALRSPALLRVMEHLAPRVSPGEPIFVARQEPLLYFATHTTNPTPFPGVLPGLRELQEPRILAALDRVRFVVMSDLDQPTHTWYREELPAVQAHLERHFEIPREFPLDDFTWIFVLARARDRGEVAFDLIERRGAAQGFLRDADGAPRPAAAELPRLGSRQSMRPLPIPLGPRGGGVDYELEIPSGATFHGAVGYWALAAVDRQFLHPMRCRISASIRVAGGDFEELASVSLDEASGHGRSWTPVEADLARFAGLRATLRLDVRSDAEIDPARRLAWWGSPRITVRGDPPR